MSTHDSDPAPEAVHPDVSTAAGGPPEVSLAGEPPPRRQSPPARVWALALMAGLIAGFASWLVGEALQGRLQPGLLNTNGFPTPEEAGAHATARATGELLEATLAFASLGAALGLALGVAGGAARRSARASSVAGISGAILGAVAGAAMIQLLLPIFLRFYDPDNEDLALVFTIQGGIGAVIGAVAGAAFGLGIGGRKHLLRPLLGGLLGGIAGVVVYEMIGLLAFPLAETTRPISATSSTRLLARLAVAILASAGATMGAWPPPREQPRAA